jgi:hypothetical protein
MDDATRSHGGTEHADTVDLASIVLGAPPRRMDAPERVPVDARDRDVQPGFDARSAAVLALVVAVLAALVGWATTIGDPPSVAGDATRSGRSASAAGDTTAGSQGAAEPAAVAPVPELVDLAVGRIVPSVDASGVASVTVGVGNAGDLAYSIDDGATLLVLVDGEVAASDAVPDLAAGASARVTLPLASCPGASAAVTAVLDPGAGVRESDERNNATSRIAPFDC